MGHWLNFYTGLTSANKWPYLFYSGFFTVISILLSRLWQISIDYRRHNCHAPYCPWIGRWPAAGGQFHYCKHHHPDHQDKKMTLARQHDIHDIWKRTH